MLIRNKIILQCFVLTVAFSLSSNLKAEERLTWEESLIQASQHHPDLISAKEGIRQSQDIKIITASSLWPQVDASLSFSKEKSSNPSTGSKSSSSTYAYGLSGSQLLFDGFKSINEVNGAKENIKASQWTFQFTSSQIRFRLRTVFVNLLKAQELIQLTQTIYDLRKQNLDLITLRYNSGTEHRGALLTAQANLAEAEFEINQAKRNLLVMQRSLIKEIGGQQAEEVFVEGNFDIRHQYIETPAFEDLARNNPQFLRLVAQRNAAAYGIKSSRGSFWPTVSVTGGAGKSDHEWLPRAQSADVGLRVSLPLLEGGSRLAQLDQSKSIVHDLEAQQMSLKDSIIVTLEQAWASLMDAMERVGVQKKFLDAAEERSKIAQQQYSVGLLNFDDWTIIEDDLVSNKKAFLNIQANALLAEASWVEAQGGTLEYAN